jgi:hypothetical protein
MIDHPERLHRDEKDLRSIGMAELDVVYADLGLSPVSSPSCPGRAAPSP